MEARSWTELAGAKDSDGNYIFLEESKVRERCRISSNVHLCGWDKDCEGRGWTASQDGWVWWRTVKTVLFKWREADFQHFMRTWQFKWMGYEDDPEVAFRAAVTAALNQREGIWWPG